MTSSTRLRFSAGNFLLFAIYGVVGPYLPLLLRGLGQGDAEVGLLLGFVEALGILGPLAVARLADRRGLHRPVLAFCGLAVALSLFPLVLGGSLAWILCALALFAVDLKSLVPVMDSAAMALLARDSAGSANGGAGRKGGYGALRAWGTVGYIAMLALLQVLRLEHASPAAIAAWIGAPALAFSLFLLALPEISPPRALPAVPPAAGAAAGAEAAPLRSRHFGPVFALGLIIIALSRLAMAPIASFFSLYVTDELGLPAVGALWAVGACAEIPLMLLSSRIIGRIGAMRAIALGAAAIVTRLAIYALVPSLGGAIAGQLLHSLCYGLFQPAAVAFVAEQVPPESRTRGMALFMGLGVSLPFLLGSALGGLVVEAAGYRILFGSFTLAALASLGLWAATRKRFGD